MSWFFFSFTRRLSCLFWFLECSDSQFFRLFADERMCFCYLILGIFSSKLRDPISIPRSKLMLTLLLRALYLLIFGWQFQDSYKHFSIYPNSFFQGCKNHLHSKGLLVHNKLQLYCIYKCIKFLNTQTGPNKNMYMFNKHLNY